MDLATTMFQAAVQTTFDCDRLAAILRRHIAHEAPPSEPGEQRDVLVVDPAALNGPPTRKES